MAGVSRAYAQSLLGQTLAGNYVIERKIGDGGMGVVYAARHTRLPSSYAVKVLQYDRGDSADADEVFRRFQAEAEITAKLRHPHIVQVIDFNRIDERTIYLVMELLEGEDLGARLRRQGSLPLTEALEITRGLGSALSAAHKLGVVHRDLKPGNLFLAREDRGEEIVEVLKVLDFGISKIRRADTVESTRVGRLLGTPQYMAPEQAQGLNHLVDARADQFAMAVIFYQMMSGQRPFDGAQVPVVLLRVMQMDPPPLSQVAPVSQAVAEVVAQAMAKRPEERFASVGDFVRALEAAALGYAAPRQSGGMATLEPATLDDRLELHVPAAVAAVPPGIATAPPEQTTRSLSPALIAAQLAAGAMASGRASGAGAMALPGLELPQESTVLFAVPKDEPAPPQEVPPTTLSGASGALSVRALPQRRSRGLWIGLSLAVALLGGGAASVRWFAGRGAARVPPPLAVVGVEPAALARAPSGAPPPAPSAAAELERLLGAGEVRLRADDPAGARASFDLARRKAPQDPRPAFGLARAAWLQRDFTTASRWLREALAIDPEQATYHTLLCQVRYRMGELRAARAACTRALQLDPQQSDATLLLRGLRAH